LDLGSQLECGDRWIILIIVSLMNKEYGTYYYVCYSHYYVMQSDSRYVVYEIDKLRNEIFFYDIIFHWVILDYLRGWMWSSFQKCILE
jgi:hypothetical protein